MGGINHLREAPWIRTKVLVMSSCHLKSNIGGRSATQKVRKEQVDKWLDHMDAIRTDGILQIITGDFNCLVDADPPPPELARFYRDGWKRLGGSDHKPTHISNRAIDAIWYRGPAEVELTDYEIYHIWQTNLSDHDAVEGRIPLPRKKAIRSAKYKNKVKSDKCECKSEEAPKNRRRKKPEVPEIRLNRPRQK